MQAQGATPVRQAALVHGPMADELGFHLRRAQIAAFKHFAHAVSAAEGRRDPPSASPGLGGFVVAALGILAALGALVALGFLARSALF